MRISVNAQIAHCSSRAANLPFRHQVKGRPVISNQDDSREAVGARLRRIREILEIDQKTFAEKAGLLPQTYGPYETGARELTLVSAKKLRKAYGLPLDFIYFGNMGDLPQRIAAKL